MHLSPEVTTTFGSTNDFVGLSQLLASAKPSVGPGVTVNIPFGVGITLNSGDQAGDQLPPLVYQKTYQFEPLTGSLALTPGQILANGAVVATESNGQSFNVNTGVLAGAVLHDIAGPIFDKYESYIPSDVRDFLLGNTKISGTPLKSFLFGNSPLDLAALVFAENPAASAGIHALQDMLEVGQYGTMLDNLNPSGPASETSTAEADVESSEDQTGIKYNILDDPAGTILKILSGESADLVTWNVDAAKLIVRAANEYLHLPTDPASLALETGALIELGLLQPITPGTSLNQNSITDAFTKDLDLPLEITLSDKTISQGIQKLISALGPALNQYGIGDVLSDLNEVFGKITNLGVKYSFEFFGDATLGVNSSFLTNPTAHGALSSFFIAAPGMNGPGTFGTLFHVAAHASLGIDLPQDLTGGANVASAAPGLASGNHARRVFGWRIYRRRERRQPQRQRPRRQYFDRRHDRRPGHRSAGGVSGGSTSRRR